MVFGARLTAIFSAFFLTASLPALAAEDQKSTSETEATDTQAKAENVSSKKAKGALAENAEDDPIKASIAFAEKLTADATTALLNDDASDTQKLSDFQDVLSEGLAVDVIGRFMIGKARKTMTEEQTKRYGEIFPAYITKLYAEQFADIVGKPLEVIDSKALNRRDVIVRTRFNRTDGAPINVDWRIRKLRSGKLKAIDIIVSGVSIMLVKREEFSAFIEQNGIDALLARLEEEAA